jgi:hypothetical protein
MVCPPRLLSESRGKRYNLRQNRPGRAVFGAVAGTAVWFLPGLLPSWLRRFRLGWLGLLFLFTGPVGAIMGLLIGWRAGLRQAAGRGHLADSGADPGALLSVVLAAGSLAMVALLCGWVAIQPPGAFHDQGGMLITLFEAPWILGFWVTSGPIALALAVCGLERARSATGTHPGRAWAWAGLILSGLIVLGGLGYVAAVATSIVWGV